MKTLNATHDPDRRSWVASANLPETDFPLQNLPFGRFRRPNGLVRCGVAIGDQIIDLAALADAGLLFRCASEEAVRSVGGDDLLPLLQLPAQGASALRAALFELLSEDGADRDVCDDLASYFMLPQSEAEMLLPTTVRHFSDMCVSTFHIGRRAGNDERGQPICPPMFRTLPVGYDGRAGSVVVSKTPVRRPNGLWTAQLEGAGPPRFGPEPRQDYELELGAWVCGRDNDHGTPIAIRDAADRIFGFCLVNDWSARGIQLWETMLGPFLGKSLATTVSPWIVTAEALLPFRTSAFRRPEGDPPVPDHLRDWNDIAAGGYEIELEARLETAAMQASGLAPATICRTNVRHMYWTFAQMVAHHASNGCALGAGDLIGSGTCSGPAISEAACLLEANMNGAIVLPNGETRMWLQDGDRVTLSGRASRRDYVPIGFGTASGVLLPAPATS